MLSLDSIANTLFHTLQLMRKGFHIPAYLLVGNPGVYLGGLNIRMSENLAYGFDGYAVRQQNSRCRRMSRDMVGQSGLPHCSPIFFSFSLQQLLLGMGNTRSSPDKPLYFSIIRLGISNSRILESVLVFRLQVIIHRLPSKNVCGLSVVSFFTSAYDKPVKIEKTKKSRTSSYVLFFIGASISVCISSSVR